MSRTSLLIESIYCWALTQIEQVLDRVGKASGDGYPPYNIETVVTSPDAVSGDKVLRITLAVAGFHP